MGGLIDAAAAIPKRFFAARAAKDNKSAAIENRNDAMRLFQSQNHQPELMSRHIGPYQRSQSPMADAFLESLLTGQNAGAVQGTRAGAARGKASAQRGFDASTGGFEALRARQRAMQNETPWQTRGFGRDIDGVRDSYKWGGLGTLENERDRARLQR
jgi:hypothetical protein